jgi:hypothetical protein
VHIFAARTWRVDTNFPVGSAVLDYGVRNSRHLRACWAGLVILWRSDKSGGLHATVGLDFEGKIRKFLCHLFPWALS